MGSGFGVGYHVVGGWDFTEEKDADPYDDAPAGFHGTHVAGIVASQAPDRLGVAPAVDLVALRVFNDMGMGYAAWVEQALTWVHEHRNDYRYPITTVNLSLGTAWNSSAPPSWATLENELAQLSDDGVFVAVAAGNSFTSYGVPGLAYPAASPYVVPAASVDGEGRLSDFSQREQRVIAAPGEQILSTVPDFIYGADGDPNDWTAASGTSMASPYVAGAAVLVREAMSFVGYAAIDQTTIYEHLRTTADLVYDTATNAYYHRLNLPRAIDTLIPDDDYGSTLDQACDLGYLADSQHISGLITSLDDVDVFQFTATANGLLNWNVTGDQHIGVCLASDDNVRLSDLPSGATRVSAGCTYTLSVLAGAHLTDYDLQVSLAPDKTVSIDGNVVRVQGTNGNDEVRFWIDSQFHLAVNGHTYSYPRSEPWVFEIDGGGGDDQLTLTGSQGSDEVILSGRTARLRGGGYELSAMGFGHVVALAGEGYDDVARFFDTVGDDEFIASGSSAEMRSTDYHSRAIGFDRVYATARYGADDVARFYDLPGDDEFIAAPDHSLMRGNGYFNKAIGFHRTYAYGSGAGHDVARFYDSPGSDLFLADSQAASMSGSDFYNKAINFERTYAYASAGADDVARLYDSAGSDLFLAYAGESYLRGRGFFNKALGFDRVYAYATPGADDVARFYDTRSDDLFVAQRTASVLRGADFYNKATEFRRVYAYAVAGGRDVAQLQGTLGVDQVIAEADRQILRGGGFYTDARGFAATYAQLGAQLGDSLPPEHPLTVDAALYARDPRPLLASLPPTCNVTSTSTSDCQAIDAAVSALDVVSQPSDQSNAVYLWPMGRDRFAWSADLPNCQRPLGHWPAPRAVRIESEAACAVSLETLSRHSPFTADLLDDSWVDNQRYDWYLSAVDSLFARVDSCLPHCEAVKAAVGPAPVERQLACYRSANN